MSFKNLDFDSVMRRLADKRIEDAMAEGKFDNLPGKGQPLELEPIPANENARLAWWALRIMRQNDFTPDEVRMRKHIDGLKDELAGATTDRRVKALVVQINTVVRQLNTLGTNAISSAMSSVSLETELRKLHERQQVAKPPEAAMTSTPLPMKQCANPACKNQNPPLARFCRYCGQTLATR